MDGSSLVALNKPYLSGFSVACGIVCLAIFEENAVQPDTLR